MDQHEQSSAPSNSGFFGKLRLYLQKHSVPSAEEQRTYNHNFALSTSFHGFRNIVARVNPKTNTGKLRKVIWSTVVIASIIIVSWQICARIINFFSWPTTTSVIVQYVENIEFPSVTFCNLNRYQTHAVNNLTVAFFLWNIVSAVLHLSKIICESYGLSEVTDFLQSNQNFSIKEFTQNYGFYLDNRTLLKCNFLDFKHVFTEYGNCFTFNYNTAIKKRKISSSGRGLSLLFDIKQSEFTDEPTLGFVDAGITFVIHSPRQPPRFDGLGLHSPVGMHAHAAIRHFKTITQEYPWGECNPNLKLKYYEVYTTYGCVQECKAHYIQKKCKCLPFLLPGEGTVECDLQKLYSCVSPALYDIEKTESCSVGTHNSTCPVPCEETDYPATISYSTFPSEKAAEFLSLKLNKSAAYMRNNLVYIDIKYHELNYKITKQQKALTPTELLSDIGGQLGLFCGASMITIFEILEYIFTYLYWMCVFLLLKTHDIPQWAHNQPGYRREV